MKLEDKIIYDYAMSFVGLPYKWGGNDPMEGFDCSGLCIEIMQAVGYYPHKKDTTATGLYRYFRDVKKWDVNIKPSLGALVFYGSSIDLISHVAFGLTDRLVLEAGSGGSRTKTKKDASDQDAYIRIRPFNYRPDLQIVLNEVVTNERLNGLTQVS